MPSRCRDAGLARSFAGSDDRVHDITRHGLKAGFFVGGGDAARSCPDHQLHARAVRGLLSDPGSGLFGDVCRVIVEDHLDRRAGRIGGVEQLEEFDEFAAAMAVLDQGMDRAGDEIDAGQQADRAWRLYSRSRAKVACMPGTGGRSGAVVSMAWIPGFSS